jgi:uncharacterized protein
MSIANLMKRVMIDDQYLPSADVSVTIEPLTNNERNETLAFLAERAIHTVILAGFIRDNGLESPLNRGTMYACRNSEGRLEGVALLGHTTLIEARTDRALRQFAKTANDYSHAQLGAPTHLIMGEQEKMERFWNYYADEGAEMRLACRELLLELRKPGKDAGAFPGLRLATLKDLELIAPVHADMAFDESGINPLDTDPVGFLQRCARRIEKGRVWVLLEDGRLIFKADIQADTPDVVYLEGVYVAPDHRGKGIGRKCISYLTRELLKRTESVCVLVNEDNQKAQVLYRLSNFKMVSNYYTIFMKSEIDPILVSTSGIAEGTSGPTMLSVSAPSKSDAWSN